MSRSGGLRNPNGLHVAARIQLVCAVIAGQDVPRGFGFPGGLANRLTQRRSGPGALRRPDQVPLDRGKVLRKIVVDALPSQ